MISVKDIPILVSLGGAILSGGYFVNDIKRDVAELGRDYRQHVAQQQETSLIEKKWKVEDRLRQRPNDPDLLRDLDEVNRLLEKNNQQQKQLKGD